MVLVVKTDTEVEGYGFGWGTKGGMRTAHTIAEVFRPELIGNDPLDRERLWHAAHRADRYGGLASFNSYGPLDVALWDIASKSANVPLYKLIGAYRDRIPAYASSPFMETPEEYASLAIKAKLDGFSAFKLHPPGNPDLDIACCEAVRTAVGPEYLLMSDPVGGNYDHEDAVRVGRALEKLEYLWLEEPLYDHDIHGLEQLSRTLDIAICAGEWNSDVFSKINTRINSVLKKNPNFTKNTSKLKDSIPYLAESLLGHVRYGTFGGNSVENVQPLLRQNNWKHRNLILAGNFNMTNVAELFNNLIELGQHPKEYSDTITIMEKIGHYLDDAVRKMYKELKKEGYSKVECSELISDRIDISRVLKKASKNWDGGYVMGGLLGLSLIHI